MNTLDMLKEIASLSGYNVTGTDTQAVANKARALRRLNQVKSDIHSRYAGRWQGAYREGWLPLVPVYSDGTIAATQGSRTITGTSTTWTSSMVGRKFLGPDSHYYKIASVASATSITLTEPYQGADVTGGVYQIWKDEYTLYPDVFSVLDFINYDLQEQMTEDFIKHSKMLNPYPNTIQSPQSYSVIGRKPSDGSYSTGTVAISINSRTLTGTATAWLGNIYPGWAITVGAYTYHVYSVDSDTQITLYQNAVVAVSAGTSYTAKGMNPLVVRFARPTAQTVVSYGYNAKMYPCVNDYDEDWLMELYPHVILDGVMKYDFLDKNDPVRASQAAQLFENSIKNAQVSDQSSFNGTYVVGLDIPNHARE